jgi:glycosyltransferase involved in cell wall biosynthesis
VSKILWLADGGSHTGFARVTHAIGERLVADHGHDVHVLAINYDGGIPWPTNLKLYVPNTKVREDIYGQSRFIELLARIEPDAVVMLNDANIVLDLLLNNKYDPQRILLRYRPILTYIPMDGHNHPPAWAEWLHKVSTVVAMSEHGQRELTHEGKVPPLVYHGVDHDRFYPVSQNRPLTLSNGKVIRSKTEAKQAFGWNREDFIVLRVDKNSGRKDYPATWKALTPFMHRHSNVRVHFHCQGSNLAYGLDVQSMLSRDQTTSMRFALPKPDSLNSYVGWPEEDLVGLYNAADVFISTSRGEGFGLTIAEASACGLPVIAQNVSAIPEVVGPGGILIDPEREITTPSGKDQWLANIPAFTDALERLYLSRGARRDLGAAGREHIEQTFNWNTAAEQMNGHIADMIAEGEKAAAERARLISEGGTDAAGTDTADERA